MMTRRRFLTLTAAAVASPAGADEIRQWHGIGLGSALSLQLVGGTAAQARTAFARVEAEVARIEATASLHRDSELTRLNRDGHLVWPSAGLLQLLTLADRVHRATDGAFDPTVQPLWRATATGADTEAARALIGWDRVKISPQEIRLGFGQALTLNGIAQGWAADRIADLLRRNGYTHALIDMGEVQALGMRPDGAPWQVRVQSPQMAALGDVVLSDRALATSSPRGTVIGAGHPHILGPRGQAAVWSTVSVSAPLAALADALSTAFCLMPQRAIDTALSQISLAKLEIAV